jgi:ribonuclease D
MTIHLHHGDLPDDVDLGSVVAIDTETMGLSIGRDRLCLVQLSSGDGDAHLVKMPQPGPNGELDAPNLTRLIVNPSILKLFHFARFDVAVLQYHLNVVTAPVYCTKIASRLVRTYTDRHGLKELVKELLDIEISKTQQSSDWGAPDLEAAQMTYAASDVLYLHQLKARLDEMLLREGRMELAEACFSFLPVRATLDLTGWPGDIFEH